MLIGAVADDITGASDLCLMLSREGLRTVQIIGVPPVGVALPDADAVVIALKSRSAPAADAVAMSLAALRALTDAGAPQIMLKYCSTFDSTDAGNIGPVTDAMMTALGTDLTIACPSFPAAGRTTYKGHLFVGDQLLSDSPLRDHPLNPMRDANLMRVLGRQTRQPIGLVDIDTVRLGADALKAAFDDRRAQGQRILIVDTLSDTDLRTIGAACADMRFITGGSGIGLGLAGNAVVSGLIAPRTASRHMPAPTGRAVVLAGSCSLATRQQIATAQAAGLPTLAIDATALATGTQSVAQLAGWAISQPYDAVPVIYSSVAPDLIERLQTQGASHDIGALIEQTLADLAVILRDAGFCRFVIAGGETSGAVVAELGVTTLEIGPEIDPGVPWTRSVGSHDLALALKSGNFGSADIFSRAFTLLQPDSPHD
ncbi:3-oxo-tetronate kinase [Loktanella sp. DJP18]|uniref:3-oxo-tetronate kinase n=1 Tax=Loktanella sp. DJP18 TaxID=3409788 RepID=UPI003BB4EA0D